MRRAASGHVGRPHPLGAGTKRTLIVLAAMVVLSRREWPHPPSPPSSPRARCMAVRGMTLVGVDVRPSIELDADPDFA